MKIPEKRFYKRCTRCKKFELYSSFWKDSNMPDGLNNWCKQCFYEWKRKDYRKNPDKYLTIVRKLYKKYPERFKKRVAEYQRSERGLIVTRKKSLKYSHKNREYISERNKQIRIKNQL